VLPAPTGPVTVVVFDGVEQPIHPFMNAPRWHSRQGRKTRSTRTIQRREGEVGVWSPDQPHMLARTVTADSRVKADSSRCTP
jgi:hypothetical protein